MAGKNQYKVQDFIRAIPGSGGIITTIAARVKCDWSTAKKYINDYPTVKAAYDSECESNTDTAESVIITNMRAIKAIQQRQLRLAQQAESEGKDSEAIDHYRLAQGDSADAKWWLTKKGKGRGFVDRQELTGPDGGDVTIRIVNDR
jgi:hypothetical protein